IAKDLDLDIFHGLSQELPFCIKKSEAKKIVTIHDLIAFHPDYAHEWFNTFFYKRKIKHAINNASVIIAISQQTADDLKQNFHIDEKKLHIIYQPVDSSFFKRVDDETKRKISEKYNLPARYILQPGNLQYRKNHLLVINALKEYPNQDLHYVIVGKPEKYLKTLQATVNTHQLQNRIHFLFEVPTTDLPALYQMSQCVIYPSLIEGYGLPIVEAMASYVPIITSKGGCFEEAGGKAAWYINPQNSEELVSALHLVLSKNEEVERRLQEGLQKASLIKAPQMADTYMQVYTSTSLT
ncbi:MAG: glycosyltransferase family 4 protein, partial [Flavobacteriales bacterium]|nr:glycosyltransferase family 4 protein [Flavobacteriales bacterium]